MNNPRLANVRVQNHSVDFRELLKKMFELGSGHVKASRQFGVAWAATVLDERPNQLIVDS